MIELKAAPCPFCGTEISDAGHPDNDCWMANLILLKDEVPAWNRRATQPASAPAEPSDAEILQLAADHHMPVRFPHEVVAFARALLGRPAVGAPQGQAEPFPQTCPVMHDGACSDRSKCAKPCGDRQGQESPL